VTVLASFTMFQLHVYSTVFLVVEVIHWKSMMLHIDSPFEQNTLSVVHPIEKLSFEVIHIPLSFLYIYMRLLRSSHLLIIPSMQHSSVSLLQIAMDGAHLDRQL
jgi:hypothetical protein